MNQLPEALQPLARYKQFILWQAVPLENGTITKKPISYQTGRPHDPHDPAIWLDFETAVAFANKSNLNCGIGFVFTEHDPFWFLDLDKCLNANNQWSQLAVDLCTQLQGCAVEVSQSGRGLHIFGTGPVPEHACKNSANGLELYTEKRFVALTGYNAYGNADFSPSPAILNWLVSRYFPPGVDAKSNFEWTTKPVEEWNGPEDDAQLLEKMLNSSSAAAIFGNRATVKTLWYADASVLSQCYPHPDKPFDHSSADAALCSHLAFWTGKNCERMDRLFRQSGLYRDKWETRQDYRERTIAHAIQNCKAVYSSKRSELPVSNPMEHKNVMELKATPKEGAIFLHPEQQQELFKGCVYITHHHRILTPRGALLKPEQFKVMYGGYRFILDDTNEKITNNAWEAFTESQVLNFPKVDDTCFRPDLEPGEIISDDGRLTVNIYVPIETPRISGDPSPFLGLINKLFPDDNDRAIILAYMAALVQYPGVKFQWAPLIQGCEGNGKSFLITAIIQAIGRRYTHLPKAENISNNFNAWLANKLFIGIEEVYINDTRHKIDAIKWMITNKLAAFEPKGVDEYTGDNRANFMCTSNHKDAIKVARKNNRRWCIFFTPQQNEDDLIAWGMTNRYFVELYEWAENDGFAIINDYLRNYAIADELNPAKDCTRAPVTTSTEEAIAAGLGPIEQEVLEAIGESRYGFCGGWVSSMAMDKLLEEKRIRLSRNKRKELLYDLGYEYHPALKEGRVNNELPTEGGKPRIYIKKGHIHANLTQPPEIVRHYLEAQGITTPLSDERSYSSS